MNSNFTAKEAKEWFEDTMDALHIPRDVGNTATVIKALNLLEQIESDKARLLTKTTYDILLKDGIITEGFE